MRLVTLIAILALCLPAPAHAQSSEADQLVAQGKQLLAQRKLMWPPGKSAYSILKRALELEPNHVEARRAMAAIAQRYMTLAREDLEAGRRKQAASRLYRARKVVDKGYGDAALLAQLEARLQKSTHTRKRRPTPQRVAAKPPSASNSAKSEPPAVQPDPASAQTADADTPAPTRAPRAIASSASTSGKATPPGDKPARSKPKPAIAQPVAAPAQSRSVADEPDSPSSKKPPGAAKIAAAPQQLAETPDKPPAPGPMLHADIAPRARMRPQQPAVDDPTPSTPAASAELEPLLLSKAEIFAAINRGDLHTAAQGFYYYAIAGVADAQYNFGVMFDTGKGRPQDYAQAFKWYRRAALQGHARAQTNLGTLYDSGAGTHQDYIKAAKWYRLAAEQGLAVAQYNLGAMYENGQGVARDPKKARHWYEKAAGQGLGPARKALGLADVEPE
ncbi:tetratricopeptide repeat protein [Magnetofaba australis]|uniref:Sel1 domain-containing protein n=1 Tax=Magnetofaba australis IT-1 TaxID=1434232 RepID=A0A1Y2K0Q4_9PROT|nr:tetratricopeptide repeat protein [Magnetofaba australis]OSM01620.1 hypothetical protein MAIT1_01630 [Magnetofaba australis IT-1]